MCIYRCEIKKFSRSKNQSAVAAAAYRSGGKLIAENDWETKAAKSHDYTSRQQDIVATGIVLPADAPPALRDRATLWNAAERAENRGNSLVAREAVLALPHELNDEQRLAATERFAAYMVERYGVGCDYAIHKPDRKGDKRNHHAHVMFTTRTITKDGLQAKTRVLDDKKTGSAEFTAIRQEWESICNNALEAAGLEERVDCRSLQDQGIHRLPEPKQGPVATAIERDGRSSKAGNERRTFKEFNDSLEQIPDEDTEEDADEADSGEPDDESPPVRRKREVSKTQAAIKEARKHDRNVARLVHRRMLELLRRLQQQRRRRQEQLRLRMQRLTRSMLMNTWRKNAAMNNSNLNSQQQAQAPITKTGLENYSEAEILAALAAKGFELD